MTTLPTNYTNGADLYASDINAITTQVNTLTVAVGSGGVVIGPSGNLTLSGSTPSTVDLASSVNLTGTLLVGSTGSFANALSAAGVVTFKSTAAVWGAVTIGTTAENQLVLTPGASTGAGITIAAAGSGPLNITGSTVEINGGAVLTASVLAAAIVTLIQGLPTSPSSSGPILWNNSGILNYT